MQGKYPAGMTYDAVMYEYKKEVGGIGVTGLPSHSTPNTQ